MGLFWNVSAACTKSIRPDSPFELGHALGQPSKEGSRAAWRLWQLR